MAKARFTPFTSTKAAARAAAPKGGGGLKGGKAGTNARINAARAKAGYGPMGTAGKAGPRIMTKGPSSKSVVRKTNAPKGVGGTGADHG